MSQEDGFHVQMKTFEGFNYPAEFVGDVKGHLDAIKNMKLRDSDIFILSFPKSGNHMVCEIISMLLRGEATYCSSILWLDVTDMEELENAPSPRLFITHIPFNCLPKELGKGANKIVYLTRNPKDVMVSYFFYFSKLSATAYNGQWDDEFVLNFLNGNVPYDSWFRNIQSWEHYSETYPGIPSIMMKFEQIKKEPQEEAKRLALFLQVQYNNDLIFEIAKKNEFKNVLEYKEQHQDPKFKTISRGGQILYRKGIVGDWKNYFTIHQNELFENIFAEKMKDSKLRIHFDS